MKCGILCREHCAATWRSLGCASRFPEPLPGGATSVACGISSGIRWYCLVRQYQTMEAEGKDMRTYVAGAADDCRSLIFAVKQTDKRLIIFKKYLFNWCFIINIFGCFEETKNVVRFEAFFNGCVLSCGYGCVMFSSTFITLCIFSLTQRSQGCNNIALVF